MTRLTKEQREELLTIFIIFLLNLAFVALMALLLWPMGKTSLAFSLAKGYGVYWIVLIASIMLVALPERILRLNLYTTYNEYVVLNLLVSAFLMAGWSAFIALALRNSAEGTPLWMAVVLYFVGLLSLYVAFVLVTTFYTGTIYKYFNLAFGLVTFIVFALWPAAGRAVYGWFFALF